MISKVVTSLLTAVSGIVAVAATIYAPPATASTAPSKLAQPLAVVKTGTDAAAAVAQYRALLGPDNGGAPNGDPTGHREINWDGVPDEQAAPNGYLADFFNAKEAPRARGAHLESKSGKLMVSAKEGNSTNTPVRFGNINPTYVDQFKTFSPERLFSPIGTNVVNLTFSVPGTDVPAAVRGFGAVYTDVDRKKGASFRYYDVKGRLLGRYGVPANPSGLSFLGVVFKDPVVARVKIVYGTTALGPNDSSKNDVAVMDDFFYGEPNPIG